MSNAQGIPIGSIQLRSVRRQHSSIVVNIPKDFAHALALNPGDYVEWTRYTDGSLRIRRFTPGHHTAYLQTHTPRPN